MMDDKIVLQRLGTMGSANVTFRSSNDYQDILSTEDCVLGALDKVLKEMQD
jgi:hypothetical protein